MTGKLQNMSNVNKRSSPSGKVKSWHSTVRGTEQKYEMIKSTDF